MAFQLNEGFVRRILGKIKHGLTEGLGRGGDGGMCVQHVISKVSQEGRDDKPSCVAPFLRDLMVSLNDSNWSTNMARAEGLKRLAVCELGTREWHYNKMREFVERVGRVIEEAKERIPEGPRRAEYRNAVNGHLMSLARNGVDGLRYASSAMETIARAVATRSDMTKPSMGSDFDEALAECCEDIVGVFCDMGAPGTAYLPITLED